MKFQEPGALSAPSGILKSGGSVKTPSRAAIHTVLGGPRPEQVSVGPPPPSASEYIPPPVFLQSMTNPQNNSSMPKSIPEYFKL